MKNIAICAGGFSSEYKISINSAQQVKKALEKSKYAAWVVEIVRDGWFVEVGEERIPVNKNNFSFTHAQNKVTFDGVFMAIHGTPGEDGKLQGYLEMLGIPHSTCNSFVAQLTFNKYVSKQLLKPYDINLARECLVKNTHATDARQILDEVGLPCFVKPNTSGSSFGVTKVRSADELDKALEFGFSEGDEILVEEYIQGTEVTCGIFKSKHHELILPVTEIVSKTDFFDYEAKYTPGMSDEITPARISDEQTKQCQTLASKIYDIFNCSGLVRVDFILKEDVFYFLEINTVPGMSENSIIPKQIRATGKSVTEVYTRLIDSMFEND